MLTHTIYSYSVLDLSVLNNQKENRLTRKKHKGIKRSYTCTKEVETNHVCDKVVKIRMAECTCDQCVPSPTFEIIQWNLHMQILMAIMENETSNNWLKNAQNKYYLNALDEVLTIKCFLINVGSAILHKKKTATLAPIKLKTAPSGVGSA